MQSEQCFNNSAYKTFFGVFEFVGVCQGNIERDLVVVIHRKREEWVFLEHQIGKIGVVPVYRPVERNVSSVVDTAIFLVFLTNAKWVEFVIFECTCQDFLLYSCDGYFEVEKKSDDKIALRNVCLLSG